MSETVFISYSHDDDVHRAKVRQLADELVRRGVDAWIDQHVEPGPPQGWPIWMTQQINQAAFIIVVCTPTYRRRAEGGEAPGVGLGATWEGMLITQVHYNDPALSGKLVPVLFDAEPVGSVPLHLQGLTRYSLPRDFDGFYRHLTRQPLGPGRPQLGSVVAMPTGTTVALPSEWSSLRVQARTAADGDTPAATLLTTLHSRRTRIFYKAVLTKGQVVGRTVRRSKSAAIPLEALLDEAGTGLVLLVGETGLGKTTALASLARSVMEQGRRVLCLGAGERWLEASEEVGRAVGLTSANVQEAIQAVFWDEFSPADLPDAAAMVERGIAVIASCTPADAIMIEDAHGTVPARYALQPLDAAAARDLYASLRPDAPQIAGWLSTLPEGLRAVLAGNPLFVRLAADPIAGDPLPRLWQVASRHLASVGKRSSGGHDRTRALEALAELAVVSAGGTFSSVGAREALRSNGGVVGEDAEKLLREFAGAGILVVAHADWLRFAHEYLPIVVLAQAQANRGMTLVASKATNATQREIALLIAAFSAAPLAALDLTCPERTDLWLRGLCLLPHDRLEPTELARAIRAFLWLDDEASAPGNLERGLRQLSRGNGIADVLGLLDALLHVRSTDPLFLGSLLFLMDGLVADGLSLVAPLRSQLFSHLPPPPARPPSGAFRTGSSSFALACNVVTRDEFAIPFPETARRARAADGRTPQVGISWMAAGAFARWMGGRLPTRGEWTLAAGNAPRSVTDPSVALFPRTMRSLSDRGPIPVGDMRLDRDPAPSGCRQLFGNVREWCSDGPADTPTMRWAMGGSFQHDPGAQDSAATSSSRGDLGFRICWDDDKLGEQH